MDIAVKTKFADLAATPEANVTIWYSNVNLDTNSEKVDVVLSQF